MNELQIIQSKIHEIRGQKVMLDRDLAELNGVETVQLKRAVRRNKNRFEGENFVFELTHSEFLDTKLASQTDVEVYAICLLLT